MHEERIFASHLISKLLNFFACMYDILLYHLGNISNHIERTNILIGDIYTFFRLNKVIISMAVYDRQEGGLHVTDMFYNEREKERETVLKLLPLTDDDVATDLANRKKRNPKSGII